MNLTLKNQKITGILVVFLISIFIAISVSGSTVDSAAANQIFDDSKALGG